MNSFGLKISHGRRNEIRLINNFRFRHKQARKTFYHKTKKKKKKNSENSTEKRKTVYDEKQQEKIFLSIFTRKSEKKKISTRASVVLRDFWNVV